MKGKLIWSIFWATVGVFVILFGILIIWSFIERSSEIHQVYIMVLISVFVVLFGLGVTLLVLTVKTKVRGMLKGFLLLAGASVAGLPVFGILHNAVGALFNTEEAVFFIIATIVCPIGFLVGDIGTIVLAIKNKPSKDVLARTFEG